MAVSVALPTRAAASRAARSWPRALQEAEVVVEDVLDAEEDVAEAGLAHQRRQRRAVRRRSATVIAWTM